MRAYIFPGQGSQFSGMGKELFEQYDLAQQLFKKANDILGFDITKIMFEGTDEELKQTKVTQPAVFIHAVIHAMVLDTFEPNMVAGHSLGEFSALVAARGLSFDDGLKLVSMRAEAMQKACEMQPSTMAAVLRYESEEQVEAICASIKDEVVVPANYNCPGQLVISGSEKGIELATQQLTEAGVRRVIKLQVGGAFHSPLMMPAKEILANAIQEMSFQKPICPIYQNVNAQASINPEEIKLNLIAQLTAPVRWTQSIQQMIADGATNFFELGPGNVLTGLVGKINNQVQAVKL